MAARRHLLPLVAIAFVVAAVVVGRDVRETLAVDPTPAGLKVFLAGLGWRGLAVFVGVVVFRQFLFVPAVVILTVGGLCFGVPLGTALGALGIVVSAGMKFGLARAVAHAWVAPRGGGAPDLERRLERVGPLLIGVSTAYPIGPLSPLHWAAGLSSLRFAPFLAVVIAAAPLRAFACSLFGATLLEGQGSRFWLVIVGSLVALALPLAHRGFRRWLFAAAP